MLKRSLLFVGIVIGSLHYAASGKAQAPGPESMVAARELIVVMRLTDQMKTVFPIIMKALKPAVVQNRPEVEKDYDALVPLMGRIMESRSDEYLGSVATIYARNFTAAQLREITAFYRTPTGQLALQKMPILMQEGLEVGQRFGAKIAGELQDRIREELRKKGHNI